MTEQLSNQSEDGLKRGQVYGIKHQLGDKVEDCVFMLLTTWTDFGTTMETFRSIGRRQDTELKETKNLLAVCQRQLGDTMQRLENLRAVRREEKRSEVEEQVHHLIKGNPHE